MTVKQLRKLGDWMKANPDVNRVIDDGQIGWNSLDEKFVLYNASGVRVDRHWDINHFQFLCDDCDWSYYRPRTT